MATNPVILDYKALKKLPVPDLSGVQPMPSASAAPQAMPIAPNPLAGIPASVMPSVLKTPDQATQNTGLRLLGDQTELKRLGDTGSGISQIKNPFLRGMARVGDVAESIIAPRAAQFTPGTEQHHQMLLGQATG